MSSVFPKNVSFTYLDECKDCKLFELSENPGLPTISNDRTLTIVCKHYEACKRISEKLAHADKKVKSLSRSCHTCSVSKTCKYKPSWGDPVRVNCIHYV